MEAINQAFTRCHNEQRPALVAYTTAGYPSIAATPILLLSLQRGGADIIELGIPFIDCVADGPTIQKSNLVALKQGVDIACCLHIVQEARRAGLSVPVILMGYYSPILAYGEEAFVAESFHAGVSGFIIADLPPEEGTFFRWQCSKAGLSFIPIIGPATSSQRMQLLADLADSFIYVVSWTGVTGATGLGGIDLSHIDRARSVALGKPIAVGFGVQSKKDFDRVGAIADGVVIGSRIINIITEAESKGEACSAVVETFCRATASRETWKRTLDVSMAVFTSIKELGVFGRTGRVGRHNSVPGRESYFGDHGGCFAAELLIGGLQDLGITFQRATDDAGFWLSYHEKLSKLTSSSHLELARGLTAHAKGARIWLKCEDMMTRGGARLHSALGQALLAQQLGKKEVVTDTKSGEFGVAIAACCAELDISCTIFIGSADVEQQGRKVSRMQALRATVRVISSGSGTYREAANEAIRELVTRGPACYYVCSTATGPHPIPTIVRTFSSVYGRNIKKALEKSHGKAPDAIITCDSSGVEVVGSFAPFIGNDSVKLVLVERPRSENHGNSFLTTWTQGLFNGAKTYVRPVPSILESGKPINEVGHPSVGPEIAHWLGTGAISTRAVSREYLSMIVDLVSHLEGFEPSINTASALAVAVDMASSMAVDMDIVTCISMIGSSG